MVIDLVREIGRVDPRDLARDTSSSRNYAGFLADLAEKIPSVFIPCISLLSVHLEEESSSMRNCVLTIFAEIVMQVTFNHLTFASFHIVIRMEFLKIP